MPHFPPSRGQTTTRDSVGFRISKCISAAAEPTLHRFECLWTYYARQVRNLWFVPWSWLICFKGGSSARSIRNIRSCDPVTCFALEPRGKFFYGTRYPVLPSPNGVLPFFVPCGAPRRAVELDSYPYWLSPAQAVQSIEQPFQVLQDVSLSLPIFLRQNHHSVPIYMSTSLFSQYPRQYGFF